MDTFFLSKTPLFHGVTEPEIRHMITCLKPREQTYAPGEIILRAGETVREIGLVESGSVNMQITLYWGNSQIFGHIRKGDIFAENDAAVPGHELLYDIVAAEETTVLFLELEKMLTTCENTCLHHQRVVNNLFRISAKNNLDLSTRMTHIAPKTIRERMISYLSEQAHNTGHVSFSIPFSRQQLADYLGVDRSALSNELSKMRQDGLITFRKNQFTLLDRLHGN